MTDTDLIAAGSGAEKSDLPATATPEISTSAPVVDQERAPQGDGALATMVLPELRALANEVGVKGTSGMRKNELIAAIREQRGEPIGKAHNGGSNETDANDGGGSGTETRIEDAPPKADADQPESDGSPEKADESTDEDVKPRNGQGGDQSQGGDQPRWPEPRRRRRRRRPAAAGGAGDTVTAGAGNGAATAAAAVAARPNCAKTTSFSPSRASWTCSTTTRSCARPVTWPARTTSTCR